MQKGENDMTDKSKEVENKKEFIQDIDEEVLFIIAQLFMVNPVNEELVVHPKKRDRRRATLVKELEILVESYQEIDSDIDVTLYQEAQKVIKRLKNAEDYNAFIDSLLKPYESLHQRRLMEQYEDKKE